MAKRVNVSIPVTSELKAAFLATCREHGCSGAEVIRCAMQTVVDASRAPDAFRAQLAAAALDPAPLYTPERMKQTVRRAVADLFEASTRTHKVAFGSG